MLHPEIIHFLSCLSSLSYDFDVFLGHIQGPLDQTQKRWFNKVKMNIILRKGLEQKL